MSLLVLVPSQKELRGLAEHLPAGLRVRTCGVGVVAAALGAARELAAARPQACLLVGLAGTRDEGRAPLGAVLEGTAVVNEAVGAGSGREFVSLSALSLAGEDAAGERIALAPRRAGRVVALAGDIGTVAVASANIEQAAAWRARHPEVLVEEMEGWAVAIACAEASVPLTVLRAVSNVAGVRDPRRWIWGPALAELGRAVVRLAASSAP